LRNLRRVIPHQSNQLGGSIIKKPHLFGAFLCLLEKVKIMKWSHGMKYAIVHKQSERVRVQSNIPVISCLNYYYIDGEALDKLEYYIATREAP